MLVEIHLWWLWCLKETTMIQIISIQTGLKSSVVGVLLAVLTGREYEITTAWLQHIALVELGEQPNGTTFFFPFYGCWNDGKADMQVLLQEEKRWLEKGKTTGGKKVILTAPYSPLPVFLSSELELTLRYLALLSVWIKPFWLYAVTELKLSSHSCRERGRVGDWERERERQIKGNDDIMVGSRSHVWEYCSSGSSSGAGSD